MIKKIDLYKEPLDILGLLENKGYTGMSEFELSFLCGVIKQFRPHKIVEVGVAAGGTTAVILNCLKLLKLSCEMYSVDISERYYKDISKKTGFVAAKFLKEGSIDIVKHQFILGNTIASSLDKIGKEIDFVILDTMHSLPGELLDFISLYHSLKEKSVIVLHDVGQSQLGIWNINGAPFEYASLVTLATTFGEKYLVSDCCRIAGISNIGAIRIEKNISANIENLFLALFINWNYIPDTKSLDEYRQRIKEEYNEQYYHMFEQAIECNMFSLYRQGKLMIPLKPIRDKFDELLKKEKVFIYGAGEISKKIEQYIKNRGQNIEGHIVSVKEETNGQKNIIELSEIKEMDDCIVILGLNEKFHLEVLDNLYQNGFAKKVFPYNGIGFRELLKIIEYENSMEDIEN